MDNGIRLVKLAVHVAMPEEAEAFFAVAPSMDAPSKVAGATHHRLAYSGFNFALVVTGIGMVNAADAAAGTLQRYGPQTLLVSAGSAGGLAEGVQLGDVIVGDELVQAHADARAFGYAAGQVPGMPPTYRADDQASRALLECAPPEIKVQSGDIASGDTFVTADRAHGIRETFPRALVFDMESAAIAQVALNHGARFAAVRAVSDLCAPDAAQFTAHLDDAASLAARVVVAAVPQLGNV